MSGALLQSFRALKSARIVTIPTRQDPKSGKQVVRWKDIQQHFKNAESILNGDNAVLFLTDDNLEDLVPLRIAHHPGVVLEVVTQDSGQDGSSAMTDPTSSHSLVASSVDRTRSMTGDMETLKITEIDDDQALVVHLPGTVSGSVLQRDSNTNQLTGERFGRSLLETDPTSTLHEELRQLRRQTEQTQRQMNKVQQKLLQANGDNPYHLSIKFLLFILSFVFLYFYLFSGQPNQQITDEAINAVQQSDHQARYSQQLLQQHIDETLQKIQRLDVVLEEARETDQRTRISRQQLQKLMDEGLQKMQLSDKQTEDVVQNVTNSFDRVYEQIAKVQFNVTRAEDWIEYKLQPWTEKTQSSLQQLQDRLEGFEQRLSQGDPQGTDTQQQQPPQEQFSKLSQQVQELDQQVRLLQQHLLDMQRDRQRLQEQIDVAVQKIEELGLQKHLLHDVLQDVQEMGHGVKNYWSLFLSYFVILYCGWFLFHFLMYCCCRN
ncbi:hypothetical protein BGX31_001912 [Mortierella sp. GBA43]|nr:hypothetical protein BGX31_001912 [Mortierella sp. GBA43]